MSQPVSTGGIAGSSWQSDGRSDVVERPPDQYKLASSFDTSDGLTTARRTDDLVEAKHTTPTRPARRLRYSARTMRMAVKKMFQNLKQIDFLQKPFLGGLSLEIIKS